MDITIVSEKDNPLLRRKEVQVQVVHGGATPTVKALLPEMCKILKSPEDTVILDKILTRKGHAVCDARVLVYTTKENVPRDKLERQQRKLTGVKKEKKAKSTPPPKAKEKK